MTTINLPPKPASSNLPLKKRFKFSLDSGATQPKAAELSKVTPQNRPMRIKSPTTANLFNIGNPTLSSQIKEADTSTTTSREENSSASSSGYHSDSSWTENSSAAPQSAVRSKTNTVARSNKLALASTATQTPSFFIHNACDEKTIEQYILSSKADQIYVDYLASAVNSPRDINGSTGIDWLIYMSGKESTPSVHNTCVKTLRKIIANHQFFENEFSNVNKNHMHWTDWFFQYGSMKLFNTFVDKPDLKNHMRHRYLTVYNDDKKADWPLQQAAKLAKKISNIPPKKTAEVPTIEAVNEALKTYELHVLKTGF